MFVPSTEELTVGYARNDSTAARMKNGMKVSFEPVERSNSSFF